MYRLFIIIIVFVLLYGVYLYISVKTIDKNKTPVLLPMGKLEDIQKEIELINENLLKGHKNLTMSIYENSIKYDLDWRIILSVIKTESSWDSLAKSPKGAKGLMQIMPIMAQVYSSLYFNGKEFNLYNLTDNLNIGSRILYDNISVYGLEKGLACYNGGPKQARLYAENRACKETTNYVIKILENL